MSDEINRLCEAARAWREKRLTMNVGEIDRNFILLEIKLQNAVEAWEDAQKPQCIADSRATVVEGHPVQHGGEREQLILIRTPNGKRIAPTTPVRVLIGGDDG